MKKLIFLFILIISTITFALDQVWTNFGVDKGIESDTISVTIKTSGTFKSKGIQDTTTVEVKPFSTLKEEYNHTVKKSKVITIVVKRTKLKNGVAYYKCHNGFSAYKFQVNEHDFSLVDPKKK